MTMPSETGPPVLTIGNILIGLGWLLRQTGLRLCALTLLFWLPMFAVIAWSGSGDGTTFTTVQEWLAAGSPPSWAVYSLLVLVWGNAALAAVAYIAHCVWHGGDADLAEAVGAALRALPSLILFGLLLTVALESIYAPLVGLKVLGLAATVMLTVVFFTFTPIAVIEQRGFIGSLSRAKSLTKGHRWRVLGLILLATAAAIALALPLEFLDLSLFATALAGEFSGLALFFVLTLAEVVTYNIILGSRGEHGPERIAEVFD